MLATVLIVRDYDDHKEKEIEQLKTEHEKKENSEDTTKKKLLVWSKC